MIKMNFKLALILLMLAIIGTVLSCKPATDNIRRTDEIKENLRDSTLVAILEMVEKYRPTDSLKLTFSVFNPTSDSLSFSKYHTPFEAFMNNIFIIIDSEGNEVGYNGPMAKRIMPPVKESFVIVAPNTEVSTIIDISKAYAIPKERTYTISYNGGNVSGMDNGKSIQIILEN